MGNAEKPKIALLSPYLEILGGGERFLLTLAEFYQDKAQVYLFNSNKRVKEKAKVKFDIKLEKVKLEKFPSCGRIDLFLKLIKYQTLFYMTDGSLFFSPCPKNFLIIQSPAHIPKKSILNFLKLSCFKIICYSKFVQNYIRLRLNRDSQIIPPPVAIDKFKPLKKENIILSVGRFFPYLHSKKQEVLIAAFKKLYRNLQFKNWRLVLIGSIDKGAEDYFKKIQSLTKGFPIEIISNLSFTKLVEFYGKAKIYWHATGFAEDLERFPEKAEHFGITTVEAMSAGCLPVVFAGGGQREIIKEGKNGFLWKEIPELIDKTKRIAEDNDLFNSLSIEAQKKSQSYSKEEFLKKVQTLI